MIIYLAAALAFVLAFAAVPLTVAWIAAWLFDNLHGPPRD